MGEHQLTDNVSTTASRQAEIADIDRATAVLTLKGKQ